MRLREPIWRDAAPGMPALLPAPPGLLKADVAVIGGGLTGLSAAYHTLRRWPGCRLLLLEKQALGAGASGRSTGMLGPGVGQSLLALARRLGPARAAALYRATLQAVADTAALIAAERLQCELRLGGQIVWAPSEAALRRLERQALLMESLGLPVERLDAEALRRRVRLPALGGLAYAQAGTLHPLRLVGGLAQRVMDRGGVLYEEADVVALEPGPPLRLRLRSGGVVQAERAVVATAGESGALPVGALPGRVLPVWLQALVTEPLTEAALAGLGWRGREGVLDARRLFSYFRLTEERRIVFGGGAPRYRYGGQRPTALEEEGALRRLAQEFTRLFPELPVTLAGGWTGRIGYVLDALPLIERARGAPHIVHAVGWCGHGVALATASGAWVAHLLTEGEPPADLRGLPWFRAAAPWVPTEAARALGFKAVVAMMGLQDSWEGG